MIFSGIKVYKGNLCDERLVRYLFETEHFDVVVHLAAQAGVTYSVKNPLSYVTNNIECLVNLLDILASHPVSTIIYLKVNSNLLQSPLISPYKNVIDLLNLFCMESFPTSCNLRINESNDIGLFNENKANLFVLD